MCFSAFFNEIALILAVQNVSSVENLALVVARVCEVTISADALARFALLIHIYRHKWLRHLASEAEKRCLPAQLESLF